MKSLKLSNTVHKLGTTTPCIDTILRDMSIAYQSTASINLGVGGFFCMSIFSKKLKAMACTKPAEFRKEKVFFESPDTLIDSI